MSIDEYDSSIFKEGLTKLGFDLNDDSLFISRTIETYPNPQIKFHIEKSIAFEATAVYLRKQLNGSFKPQVYLFDFTDKFFNEENEYRLTEIQKKIWTSGEAPLACIFFKTEIKIIDCTTYINSDYTPTHLVNDLALVGNIHNLYNQQFAIKIKSGLFWEEPDFKYKFKFRNSAYGKLIENVHRIVSNFKKEQTSLSPELINKIIVQAILIKYLEERIDYNGNKLLSDKYFKKYDRAETFNDVLRKGKFADLLIDLNDVDTGFNGNIFKWDKNEELTLRSLNLSQLADLLDTKRVNIDQSQLEIDFPNWRYFEFKYIPVELISRLYEEFLGSDKKNKGLFYTPAHLAKLLVDECLPLTKYNDIDLENYQILDPACGSGIFLVVVFKRLVQIWRLQNNLKLPQLPILKKLLRNIYGIDKEEQAIRLASFSLCLALCNELEPVEIISKLKFDDLREHNLVQSDFFVDHKLTNKKFNLIIGNPPFVRGGTKNFINKKSSFGNNIVEIPNNQIALKFLADSYNYLKNKGLQCLIIKSSGLIYNSTSQKFMNTLFSKTNVIQILDFTGLARNMALWDNKSTESNPLEVDTSAIFINNESIDFKRNILHVTFRRTKATKERIVFEIDDYDLHFVSRKVAADSLFIWKSNLLGGGRVKSTIEKLSSLPKLKDYLNNNQSLFCSEGPGGPQSLPNEAFTESGVDAKFVTKSYLNSFENLQDKLVFEPPVLLIKKNIDIPVALSDIKIKFSNEIIGIHADYNNRYRLESIYNFIRLNADILKFYNICTSGKMLIYKNTACKKEDILNFPFDPYNGIFSILTGEDYNIINDINGFMQKFIRNGENSKAVKKIEIKEFESLIFNYGQAFSSTLNLIYEEHEKQFRLSDVVSLNNSFIATIFKYDSNCKEPEFHHNLSKLNLKELTDIEVSKQLSISRIIKIYPKKDTIVFIKPNQYRYWLSLIAYRDADKCFSDLSNAGF